MIKQPVSIFNDVIGPVMRGPSSSHVAAAVRIGKLARQMVKGNLKEIITEFDPNGSLATTYHGHGSDMGLVGGLLDLEPSDPRLINALKQAEKTGMKVSFPVVEYGAEHPNTYKMTLVSDRGEIIHTTAISVGGGMMEYQLIEGFDISIAGDFYETLLFVDEVNENRISEMVKKVEKEVVDVQYCEYDVKGDKVLLDIKTCYELSSEKIEKLKNMFGAKNTMQLSSVLPILSRKNCVVPFNNAQGMLQVAKEKDLKLWQLATLYESARGDISEEDVFAKMKEIVTLMNQSIDSGLKGTSYEDRILGPQAYKMKEQEAKLIPNSVLNTVIISVTSLMEVKSSMGVIVAAPTAGSCGGLPGTIIGASREMGLDIEAMTKAMLAAGMIGVFIAEHATFAAEVGGCQAECGAGSGMAAAGLVQLAGGTAIQGVDAASVALQNILGMVCDPVADRVEVPCLGKNVMAGANALACANMALAGFDKVIPLDETINTMYKVGRMIPSELRCTGYGGLSITETSKKIYKNLNQ